MELDGLADAHVVAHRHRPRVLVGTDDVADQEVPLAELGGVLIDHHPDVQAPVGPFLVFR